MARGVGDMDSGVDGLPDGARPDILVVDDDPMLVRLMGHLLENVGRLRFATSGAAALDRVREVRPDLVLLDAEMPEMSGLEVCRRLRAERGLDAVRVIFVTAHTEAGFARAALDSGADDVIAKPLDVAHFAPRVRATLAGRPL